LSDTKQRIHNLKDYLLTKVKNVEVFNPTENGIKYIGMRIMKVNSEKFTYFQLDQSEYINKMDIYDTSELSSRIPKIPMPNQVNLRIEKANPNNNSLLPVTGTLRYLCDRTRPDILLATGEISTGGAEGPSDSHLKVAKQIYQYVKNTSDIKLKLGGETIFGILGDVLHFYMTDATFVTIGNSKSRLAFCGWIGTDNGAYNCVSVNDNTVSLSSTESEIKALCLCAMNIMHTRRMLRAIGYNLKPTYVFVDNKATIELAKTLKLPARTRHIQPKINYIRERINHGDIQILFVPTKYNVADTLTKALPAESFHDHADKLLNGFKTIDPLMNEIITLDYAMSKV
jgi:hypothetical protein